MPDLSVGANMAWQIAAHEAAAAKFQFTEKKHIFIFTGGQILAASTSATLAIAF